MNTLFGFSNNFMRHSIEILYKGENGKSSISFPLNNTFALDAFGGLIRYFMDSINGQAMNALKLLDSIYIVDVIKKLYQSASAGQENICVM